MKPNIAHHRLKEVIRYDPDTGNLIWIKSTGTRSKVGAIAGSRSPLGYVILKVDGKYYSAHRLAWFYMTSEWPNIAAVDHIDRNGFNNKWNNLRNVNRQENGRNTPARNKLGIKGVSQIRNRFYATITVDRKSILLGSFDSAEEAGNAYKVAAAKYHDKNYNRITNDYNSILSFGV